LSYDGFLLYCLGGGAESVRVGIVAVSIVTSIAAIVYVAFVATTADTTVAVSFAASYII
jgi:hypothetical protein